MRGSSPRRDGRRGKALRLASELGLDTAKLEQDAQSPAIEGALAANEKLSDILRVRGVPFHLVGDRPVRANEDLYAQLVAAAAEIRQNGCRAAC
jgi:predicted DsbA family dithiol-disulfide isomerase